MAKIPRQAYVIFNEKDILVPWSLAWSAEEAMDRFIFRMVMPWDEAKLRGYYVASFLLTMTEETAMAAKKKSAKKAVAAAVAKKKAAKVKKCK